MGVSIILPVCAAGRIGQCELQVAGSYTAAHTSRLKLLRWPRHSATQQPTGCRAVLAALGLHGLTRRSGETRTFRKSTTVVRLLVNDARAEGRDFPSESSVWCHPMQGARDRLERLPTAKCEHANQGVAACDGHVQRQRAVFG